MNKERVEQLVQQVGTDTSGKWISIDKMNQFTELVVQECIQLNGKELSMSAHSRMLDIYLEHFGVEL